MLGTLVLSLSVGVAAGSGGPGVAIPNGSTYDALINPAAAPAPGWNTSSSFVETGWTLGAQAPFGHGMACALNAGEQTDFPMGKTIYLRKSFALPANAFGLHVVGTVDNYADVYVNGNNVQGDVSSGNCQTGAIDFTVPNSKLVLGGANLAAVQASDDGSTASYFDMKATYGSIDFGRIRSTFQLWKNSWATVSSIGSWLLRSDEADVMIVLFLCSMPSSSA